MSTAPSAATRLSRRAHLTSPAPRVFSYVVTHDTGFSPHPFHGLLTLACCKPVVRRSAAVGDVVLGMSNRCERVVYAMRIAEIVGFEEYWADPRFRARRPRMGSEPIVDRTGDNIYEPVRGGFRQLHSRHSTTDGSEDPRTKARDLGGQHVLVGERFTYWGGSGPALPESLTFLRVGRAHRSQFTEEQVETVMRWLARQPPGVQASPSHWKAGDESWREQ